MIVGIHEAGHLLAARLFRVPVQKCYIFFNPYYTLFKFKTRRTEYGIGWLPLGGYTAFRPDRIPMFKRIIIYASGPFASILFGLIGCEMVGEYLYCIATAQVMELTEYSFITSCAFFSLILGVANLIPFGSTDGSFIYVDLKKFYNLRYIYKKYEQHKAGRRS